MPNINLNQECSFVRTEINHQQNHKSGVFKHKLLLIIKTLLCEIINEKNKAKKQVREKIYLKTKKFYLTNNY